jgi:hypothetical protein
VEVTDLYVSFENTVSQNRASFNSLGQSDFLLCIANQNSYPNWNYYVDTGSTVSSYTVNLSISNLRIVIVDQLGRSVDFRGCPWTLQIYIEFGEDVDAVGNAADNDVHSVIPFNELSVAQPLYRNTDRLFPKEQNQSSIQYVKRRKFS